LLLLGDGHALGSYRQRSADGLPPRAGGRGTEMAWVLPREEVAMRSDEGVILVRDAHEAVAGYARQVENRAWQALYNFLTANSILVLAWGALYTRDYQRPSGTWSVDGLMFGLSVVGFLLSVAWASFGVRNCAYNKAWAEQLERMENSAEWRQYKWWPRSRDVVDDIQGRSPFFFLLSFQSVLLGGTPLLFSVLYMIMGGTVLEERPGAVGALFAELAHFAPIVWAWAVLDCLCVHFRRQTKR
jgi:hypothetical protein